MNDIVGINSINFAFAQNPIFTDFSCSVSEQEITAIIGNSGCGKSTLLNLIAGLLMPVSGKIAVNGSIAFLTQYLTLLPYRNAFENAMLACELREKRTEQQEKEADVLFDIFKLSENSKNKFPQELSGGMQQRVGLIQTLLIDAHVYLLDEPLKEIDRATGLTILNYIWQKFKTKRISALIVTHDIEQAVLVSDKILFLAANKPAKEFVLDRDFSASLPENRLKSDYYNQYILYAIKKLSEL
jgi:ABC-type nitrate/sulfonate/bicarbonate transport system ATPase subunit